MDRDALIRELSQNFSSGNEIAEKRYREDTQTLHSGTDDSQLAINRHELAFELEDYSDVILGKRVFCILKDEDYSVGDTLVFRECKNLKPTGNINIKVLTIVEKNCLGLTPGYCVVSWL